MFSQLSNNDYGRKIFPRNVIKKNLPKVLFGLEHETQAHKQFNTHCYVGAYVFVCIYVGDKFNDMASSFKNTYYPASKWRKHKTTNSSIMKAECALISPLGSSDMHPHNGKKETKIVIIAQRSHY